MLAIFPSLIADLIPFELTAYAKSCTDITYITDVNKDMQGSR